MSPYLPPTRLCRRRAASAFTLIELLTVIAIIGILAAIIIPTVSGVRERAKAIQCSNRIRQWGMAVTMYANDNRGRYDIKKNGILWCQISGGGISGTGGLYIPYMSGGNTKNYDEVMRCPSGKGEEEYLAASGGGSNTPAYFAYAISRPHVNGVTIPERDSNLSVPLNFSKQPSRTILMIERAYQPGSTAYNTGDYASIDKDHTSEMAAGYTNFTRHNNRLHVVFMDGSAKALNWSKDMVSGSGRGASFNTELLKLD